MIAGLKPAGFYEIRWRRAGGGMDQLFVPVTEAERAAGAIVKRSESTDVYLGAATRVRESGRAEDVGAVWALFCDCDSPGAVDAVRRFKPLPAFVVRSGTGENVHCYWPLSEPIPASWAKRACRRLAGKLDSDRNAAEPARVLRPAGSFNHKHDPPVEVVCVRLEPVLFTLADVVGRLPDLDPSPVPTVPVPGPERSSDPGAALAGLARVVRDAPVGQRNSTLNWSSYKAGVHVAAGELDPTDAERELRAAAIQAGLSEAEAERTIRSGLNAGIAA
jgi:hypothetical protein